MTFEAVPDTGLSDGIEPAVTTASDTKLFQMAQVVAYAMECPAAGIYWSGNASPAPALAYGLRITAERLPETVATLLSAIAKTPNGLLIVTRAGPLFRDIMATVSNIERRHFSFLVATAIHDAEGAPCGVVIATNTAPREGISRAQGYVFKVLAAQISALRELDHLRRAVAPEIMQNERLRLLESVVVNAKDAVLITEAEPIDLPGPKIVYCNAAFTATTGYTQDEVLSRTPRLLQGPNTDRAALSRLRVALSRWEPVEVELLNLRKDGTEFWVELSIVPVADQNGWFTHWVSVQRDITERKRAAETLLRASVIEAQNQTLEAEIQERRRIEARLLYTAFHDDLTRLRNRAYFMDHLREKLARQSQDVGHAHAAPECAVLFLDLDRFKLINDSLGHHAGDLLLVEASNRIKACIRPQDTLARLGGDEFAVLIEGIAGLADAEAVAGRIAAAMQAPFLITWQDVFSSCSIGIVFSLKSYGRPEDVLRDADIAMYQAKNAGAGGHVVFNAAMHGGAVQTFTLQTDLRHAVARREFIVQYQPIFNTATRLMTGSEALVRWRHPEHGLIPPDRFIPMAEEIGLIRDIDRAVLHEACGTMRTWLNRLSQSGWAVPGIGFSEFYVSVNISSSELMEADFVQELDNGLAAASLDPRMLQLEITESVFIHHLERIGAVLEQIRARGIKVALDDFGTGYSSLGYLDRFQIDTLKIDRSFIVKMMTHPKTRAIVNTILHLGRSLGLNVVAEGVENEAEFKMLLGMGCDSVQGYLLGSPVAAAEIEARLIEMAMFA